MARREITEETASYIQLKLLGLSKDSGLDKLAHKILVTPHEHDKTRIEVMLLRYSIAGIWEAVYYRTYEVIDTTLHNLYYQIVLDFVRFLSNEQLVHSGVCYIFDSAAQVDLIKMKADEDNYGGSDCCYPPEEA